MFIFIAPSFVITVFFSFLPPLKPAFSMAKLFLAHNIYGAVSSLVVINIY